MRATREHLDEIASGSIRVCLVEGTPLRDIQRHLGAVASTEYDKTSKRHPVAPRTGRPNRLGKEHGGLSRDKARCGRVTLQTL